MMSMFGNMGGENRSQHSGQNGWGGFGGGFGGGRMMRPIMQQFRQNGGDDWRTGMQSWMQSAPVQSWMAQRPQRPEGGWDGGSRQPFIDWFNQAPDAPWGPMPDWMPRPQPTPSAGGHMPGLGGAMGRGGGGGQPGGTPAPTPQAPPMAQFPQYSQGWATRGLPPGIPISQLLQAATGSTATQPASSGNSGRNWRD